MSVLTYFPPDQDYRRSAHWPIGSARLEAYLRAMTTYTTPHFATGPSDRNVRPEPALNRTRPASAAPYRTAGVSDEAALMAAVHTDEWQPGKAKTGVPKAAIGALGVTLIGGAALAIVLLSPSNKVTKQVMPDPIAQATAQNNAAQKSVDSSAAAVDQMNQNPPAAGDASSTQQQAPAATAAAAATPAPAPAVPAPVQAAIPDAPPVANAPVARVHHTPTPTPRVASQPVQQSAPQPAPMQSTAPVVTPDAPAAPAVTPPADVQPPAMQQTPDAPTVTPSVPTPAPTPDTPAPTPAPAQSE